MACLQPTESRLEQEFRRTSVADLADEVDLVSDELGKTRPTAATFLGDRPDEAHLRESKKPMANLSARSSKSSSTTQRHFTKKTSSPASHRPVCAETLNDTDNVLTHCNAGALATGGVWGTALGVIRGAVNQGKTIR